MMDRKLSNLGYYAFVSINNEYLFGGNRFGSLKIWSKDTLSLVADLNISEFPILSGFVYDSSVFVGNMFGEIFKVSLVDFSVVNSFKAHRLSVSSIYVSDGVLYSVSRDRRICLWDLDNLSNMDCVTIPHNLSALSIYLLGDVLILGLTRGYLGLFDINSFEFVDLLRVHSETIFSISAYGDFLISGSRDGGVKVFSLNDLSEVFYRSFGEPILAVYMDDKFSYVGVKSGKIYVLDRRKFETVSVLVGHNDTVLEIVSDDDKVYSGAEDNSLIVWSKENFSLLKKFS